MGRFFSSDNGIFRAIDKAADFLGLSGLCLVCSLPLVTLGPAAAALYYSTVKCLCRGEEHPYGSFFSAFRENWKTGAGLSLILLPLNFFLLWGRNLVVHAANAGVAGMAAAAVAYTVALVIPLGVLFLAFPLISRFSCGVGQALGTAFHICLRHLPSVAVVVVWNGAVFLLAARYALLLVPPLVAPGLMALGSSLLLEPVFKRYTPAEETDGEDKPWYLK